MLPQNTVNQWLPLPLDTGKSLPFRGVTTQAQRKLSFQPFGDEQIAPGSFESPVFTNNKHLLW